MSINRDQIGDDASLIQIAATSAAKAESGVRARWVELPDCRHWCNFLDAATCLPNLETPLDDQPSGDYIPLRDDLANAIIATCKGPEPGCGPAVCVDPVAPVRGGWAAHPFTAIYDPVWKTSTVIPNIEHQVQGAGVHAPPTPYDKGDHQKTIINQTEQVEGPKGDFYTHWNWAYQSKDTSWDPESGGGVNYTGDMTTDTAHGWNPSQKAADDAPWTNALVFLGEEN